MSSILDSKDNNDPNSVIYKGVLTENWLEKKDGNENKISNHENGLFICDKIANQ